MNQASPRSGSLGHGAFGAFGFAILLATAVIIWVTYGGWFGSPEGVPAARTKPVAPTFQKIERPKGVTAAGRNAVAPEFQKFERAASSTMSLRGTIPTGGVALLGDELVDGTHPTLLYLDPATAVTGMMSEAQAEQDALKYDNAPGLRATGAVLATVTAPGDVPAAGIAPLPSATIGTVAWVVEVSPPSPVPMNVCNNPSGPQTGPACTVYVAHNYVVLDPTTGAFRIGLFS
jgi:hypothetical protein